MGEQLTGEDFNNLFRYFTSTAVRLETQPVDTVTDERESFEEFLAGEPRPVTDFRFYALWLERIRAATAEGKRVERVRVLEEPPTDYQRWEMRRGQYNMAAGEVIRYITPSRTVEIGLLSPACSLNGCTSPRFCSGWSAGIAAAPSSNERKPASIWSARSRPSRSSPRTSQRGRTVWANNDKAAPRKRVTADALLSTLRPPKPSNPPNPTSVSVHSAAGPKSPAAHRSTS